MADYLAIVRKGGVTLRVRFEANGVARAVEEMLKRLGITSTNHVEEFDLMEIVDAKKCEYKSVAIQAPKITRHTNVAYLKPHKQLVVDELKYAGYTVREG
jgi:hypothetical protein